MTPRSRTARGGSLASVPVAQRTRLAWTLAAFALLLAAIAVTTGVGLHSAAGTALAGVAGAVALLLALMCWGVTSSISATRRGAGLPRTSACTCGHDHDPDELHVTDAAPAQAAQTCDSNGDGADCGRNCGSCVLVAAQSEAAPSKP